MEKRLRALLSALFLGACLLLFQNCSQNNVGSNPNQNFPESTALNYFKTTQKIVVDVYYEPGAEPFADTTLAGMPYWQILEDNLQAIFQYRSSIPVLVVPKQINEMNTLPAQNKTDWLGTEILDLHSRTNQERSTAAEAHFSVYFLKGYFNSGSGPSNAVLGVSLSGTPVLAIFKDVINSSSSSAVVKKYVEQSTLVHEMGHALGFVNNGVPMATHHQDTAHGAHTTNSDCVMYWMNEGAGDLRNFVQKYITSGSTVMWGPEVLLDAKNYSE
ncbi:hypothetical protein [Bdellovibrio reynosensis]|uniref:Uncharacterized protein n=1 Tax=Bdellovibrio reynosensis TaxID=2835041 RepID=A0ABY4CCS2_9BACT|nr:hypothetical protein [Bdellovibrio reynosensis]UOF02766.1 hypothetical protein MNR06_07355 [Bdellovibrio reynosensis]